MSKERIETLQKAREKLVENRHTLAASLAGEYERGETDGWRKAFVDTQATIDAIDAAIADEQSFGR